MFESGDDGADDGSGGGDGGKTNDLGGATEASAVPPDLSDAPPLPPLVNHNDSNASPPISPPHPSSETACGGLEGSGVSARAAEWPGGDEGRPDATRRGFDGGEGAHATRDGVGGGGGEGGGGSEGGGGEAGDTAVGTAREGLAGGGGGSGGGGGGSGLLAPSFTEPSAHTQPEASALAAAEARVHALERANAALEQSNARLTARAEQLETMNAQLLARAELAEHLVDGWDGDGDGGGEGREEDKRRIAELEEALARSRQAHDSALGRALRAEMRNP